MSKETLKMAPDVGSNPAQEIISSDLLPLTVHEGDESEAVLVSSPTSKAGTFWQYLLTEREFSIAYLNALLDEDQAAIADALDILDMSVDDADLTREEYTAFMHGRTPSGALELTAWGGYYETKPLPGGAVFALLIFSRDNRVFWGPVHQFFEKTWSKYQVKYQISKSDTTLSFSSTAGDVVLTFSRAYDEKNPGTLGAGKFVGTIEGVSISGTQENPPPLDDDKVDAPLASFASLHASGALDGASSTPALALHATSSMNADTNTTDAGSESVTTVDYWSYYKDGFKDAALLLTMGAVLIGVCKVFWPWAPAPLRRATTAISNQISRFQAWKLRRIMRNEIDLEQELKPLKEKVEQTLNDTLNYIDYEEESVDDVIKDPHLSEVANEAMSKAIKDSVKLTVEAFEDFEIGDLPKSIEQDSKAKLKKAGEVVIDKKVASVMKSFSPESAGIQALIESTALAARKEFYTNHAESLGQEYRSAMQDVADAKDKQQKLDLELRMKKVEIEKLEKEIPPPEEKLREARERQAALEREIAEGEQDVKDKEKVARDVARDRISAEEQRDRRDLEERRERVEKEAERHMEDGLKK